MLEYLKVKVKSLAEETKIIVFEENKIRRYLETVSDERSERTFRGLYAHRKGVVAPEQRATFIAYAFLKGRKISDIEVFPEKIPLTVLQRASKMVDKYRGKQETVNVDFARFITNMT